MGYGFFIAAIGVALLVMFGGVCRLKICQNKNYGSDPECLVYVRMAPILLSFIPLYSMEKHTWFKG